MYTAIHTSVFSNEPQVNSTVGYIQYCRSHFITLSRLRVPNVSVISMVFSSSHRTSVSILASIPVSNVSFIPFYSAIMKIPPAQIFSQEGLSFSCLVLGGQVKARQKV